MYWKNGTGYLRIFFRCLQLTHLSMPGWWHGNITDDMSQVECFLTWHDMKWFDFLVFQWNIKLSNIIKPSNIIKHHQRSPNIIKHHQWGLFEKSLKHWWFESICTFSRATEPFKLNSCVRMTGYHRPVPIMARCKLYPILGHTSHCNDSHENSQRTYRRNVSGLNKNSFPQQKSLNRITKSFMSSQILQLFLGCQWMVIFSPHLLNQPFDPRVFFGAGYAGMGQREWTDSVSEGGELLGTDSNWFQISCWEVKGWKNICQNGHK